MSDELCAQVQRPLHWRATCTWNGYEYQRKVNTQSANDIMVIDFCRPLSACHCLLAWTPTAVCAHVFDCFEQCFEDALSAIACHAYIWHAQLVMVVETCICWLVTCCSATSCSIEPCTSLQVSLKWLEISRLPTEPPLLLRSCGCFVDPRMLYTKGSMSCCSHCGQLLYIF